MLTSEDARDLLKLFGSFVHSDSCRYVQRNAECDCNRFRLYTKVRAIAYPPSEVARAAQKYAHRADHLDSNRCIYCGGEECTCPGPLGPPQEITDGSEHFGTAYMGTFETDQRLYDLGVQYHDRCDAFDDEHLTGPFIRGRGRGVTPANTRERRLMVRNARAVCRHVLFLGEQMGYTRDQIEDAISKASMGRR